MLQLKGWLHVLVISVAKRLEGARLLWQLRQLVLPDVESRLD